jgi:hypothetical protein
MSPSGAHCNANAPMPCRLPRRSVWPTDALVRHGAEQGPIRLWEGTAGQLTKSLCCCYRRPPPGKDVHVQPLQIACGVPITFRISPSGKSNHLPHQYITLGDTWRVDTSIVVVEMF